MQSVCFPLYIAADDRVRLLTKPEKADFALHFCPLAAMNRRQPGVIPAMPLTMLSKKLGLDKKIVLKRLLRLSSPGIELIDIQYDAPGENGELSLLSSVSVEILDFAEWNGLDEDDFAAPGDNYAGPGDDYAANGTGSGHQNGYQSGAQDGMGAIAVKPGTIRVRRLRERQRAGSNGSGPAAGSGHGSAESNASDPNSNAKALQNGSGSVTPSESVTLSNGRNGTSEALRPSRVPDDNVQRNGLNLNSKSNKDQDSETLNVTNVTAGNPVTPEVTPGSSGLGSSGSRGRPINHRAKSLTSEAVRLARLLKDDTPRTGFPQGNIPRHYQLLDVCEKNNLLDLVQTALDQLARRQRRPGLRSPGAYYCDSLVRMLGERGVHVPTKEELEAEPASEVQRMIQESLDAAAQGGIITPLDSIMPEMEDEH